MGLKAKKTKETNEQVMTSEEKTAIEKEEARKIEEGANIKRLELATGVVSEQFGLSDDYSVNQFSDKGKVVKLQLENPEFIINVTIKDSERHGMHIEQ